MIRNYLKIAWRNITRQKAYSGINIMGLAIGIAACLLILQYVSFELDCGWMVSGGYDPVDLGRGVTYAGNPRFWVVAGQRLYLFGREENRDAFAAAPARFLKDAAARWPALERGLAQ